MNKETLKLELKKSLAYLKEGRWKEAHKIVQSLEDAFGYRIHGLLHYIEGDISNSRFWYSRAKINYPFRGVDPEQPSKELINEEISIIESLMLEDIS